VASLQTRVLDEGGPCLLGRIVDPEVARTYDMEGQTGEELTHLRELALVLAGEQDVHPANGTRREGPT
jgi:hypothetical protein